MRRISLLLLLIPCATWGYEFDRSTPHETYQSCVIERDSKNINIFYKDYLSNCVTREGQIDQLANLIIGIAFLESLAAMPEPDYLDNSQLDRILNEYGGVGELDKNIEHITKDRLDSIYLDLIDYWSTFDDPDEAYIIPKMTELVFEKGHAKGTLEKLMEESEQNDYSTKIKFKVSENETIYFKKEGNNWLIHESPKND